MKRLAQKTKNALRQVRHQRVRATVKGTAKKPRLSIFRGLKSITAQIIDDVTGKTICFVKSGQLKADEIKKATASTKGGSASGGKVAAAYLVGQKIAEAAKAKGITMVVFDRGGYQYHGRVEAVAEGARAGGLQF